MQKIDVFDYIDRAAAVLDANLVGFTHAADKLTEYLTNTFGDIDATIGVTSRIKTRDSLKEKILRNNLYKESSAERLVFDMHDIIGIKIECRFFKDEEYLYEKIREVFCQDVGDGFYSPVGKKAIKLKLGVPQPERQKNGYAIYRIDGNVLYAGESYNFELQIKSLVNSFWSEIEHKLIYKNNRLNQSDNLIKEMLLSTHESLSGIDHQLNLIFDRVAGNSLVNQHEQLKNMVALGINEMFTAIVKANTGIPVAITEYTEAVVEYLLSASSYVKDMSGDSLYKIISSGVRSVAPESVGADDDEQSADGDNNYSGLIISLMEWMRNMDYGAIAIGEQIKLEPKISGVGGEIAKVFLNGINSDFYLNTFFHIFFSLERGTDEEDFASYIDYYANRIVGGKTQEQMYKTLAALLEVPTYKLPLESTIVELSRIA
ncbi:MAG: hypothetical protein NC184_03620 [Roseburia sp.]|nr:hypothetical protein [Roseburia sp.]